MDLSSVLAALTPEQRSVVEQAINRPSERNKKFRVVTAADGSSMIQGYGLGFRLNRSQATWLAENAETLAAFLDEHPEIK